MTEEREDFDYDSPKSGDNSAVDYELDLTVHTIFKETENAPTKTKESSRLGYEQCIPLLIKDIPKIKTSGQMGCTSSIFGVEFRELQIYGHVVPLQLKFKQNDRIYSVDDGTGAVRVTFRHTAALLENERKIDRLSEDLKVAKREGLPILGTNPKSAKSIKMFRNMEILLRKIKQQQTLPSQFFTLGAKVAVVALPYRTANEIRLWATEMIEDSETSRSKEIFFKNELIRTYKNLYSKHKD